jgi:hypothetical protein
MKILVLDDSKERHLEFDRRYSGHKVKHVYRYQDCIDQLIRGGWDLVHLDHDLGDEVENADITVDGWGRERLLTGLDVVRWLCGSFDNMIPAKIVVHSTNPAGGTAMCQELRAHGIPVVYDPFSIVV